MRMEKIVTETILQGSHWAYIYSDSLDQSANDNVDKDDELD